MIVDVAPWPAVLPFWSIPLPSTAIACGTDDGFDIVIVTLPDFALSDDTVNLSWPPGSAESLRLEPAALPWGGVVLVGGFAAVTELDVVLVLAFFLLLPQPVAISATQATATRTAMRFIRVASGVDPGVGTLPDWFSRDP